MAECVANQALDQVTRIGFRLHCERRPTQQRVSTLWGKLWTSLKTSHWFSDVFHVKTRLYMDRDSVDPEGKAEPMESLIES